MKREFLEQLGLTKEAVDAVMAEHGKSLGGYKSRCEDAEKVIKEMSARLTESEGEASTLREEKSLFTAFRDGVIEEMIAEAKPSSRLAEAEMRRRLAAVENGRLRACLYSLREEFPEAFTPEAGKPIFSSPAVGGYFPESNKGEFAFRRIK